MGQTRPLLFIFAALQCKVKYNTNLTLIDQSIDVVHGIRSQGSRMEGADESTELRRHPTYLPLQQGELGPKLDLIGKEITS